MSGSNAATAMTDVRPNVVASPVRWGAVYAMALSSFVLVTSEFMPVSLLSPMGRSLTLSDGQVGHAIAVSAAFALTTSLLVGGLFGRLDRRTVLLGLTTLLIVSGTVVPFAPNYAVLMVGRALLGVAIGGFWSMSAAIAMRLVPSPDVPKALAVINGGNALASVLAAPLGSFMEGMLGWRGTFLCILPVSAVAVLWLASSLPSLPARARRDGDGVLRLLRRRSLVIGLGTVALFFMGQFSLFTYLRPFLEQVTGIGVPTLSLMLLLVGMSGLIGTWVIGRVLDTRRLHLTLSALPAVMALVAMGLTLLGTSTAATAALLAVWGFAGTAAPVAWWTWLARTVPDEAEAAGGLMVGVIQLAITVGAAGGGVVFDRLGATPEFLVSAALLSISAASALLAMGPRARSA